MRSSKVKPWLNEDGSTKSDAELREICSGWEKYLSTFEVSQRENFVLTPSVIYTFSTEKHSLK